MRARINLKNPFTPTGKARGEPGPVTFLEVATRNGEVVLTPIRTQRADAVRAKLAGLDLTANDFHDAVAWAREASAAPRTGGR